jgi:hypothetical protein
VKERESTEAEGSRGGFIVCECGRHGDYVYPGARCVCGRIVKNADEQARIYAQQVAEKNRRRD